METKRTVAEVWEIPNNSSNSSIPTKEELNPTPKPKKSFWGWLKIIVLFGLPLIVKNQKPIKGNTKNEKIVDGAIEALDEIL